MTPPSTTPAPPSWTASWVTNGGRVLGVTATAATLPEALKKAYAAADNIHFDKLQSAQRHRRTRHGCPESEGLIYGISHLCGEEVRF